jgi:hypothetical protein
MKRGLLTKLPLLALALVLALAGFQAMAEEPQAAEQPQPSRQLELTEDGYMPTTIAGVRIFVDPETGQMRPPSDAEAAQLAVAMKRMFSQPLNHVANVAPVEHADGTVSLVLDPSYLSQSVLRIDENGEVHTDCVGDLHTALEVLDTPVAQPEEE